MSAGKMCFGEDALCPVGGRVANEADDVLDAHTAVYHRISALLGDYVDGMGDRNKKIVDFASPADIISIFSRCACMREGEDARAPSLECVSGTSCRCPP